MVIDKVKAGVSETGRTTTRISSDAGRKFGTIATPSIAGTYEVEITTRKNVKA